MSETTRNIILCVTTGICFLGYAFIAVFGLYITDPDRIKRRKKKLKAQKKMAL